jgi:hypothetical protein
VAKAEAIATAPEDDAGKTSERVAWALRRGLDTAVSLILDPPDEQTVYSPDAAAGEGGEGGEGKAGEEEGEAEEERTTTTPTVDEAQLFDFASSPEIAGRW